MRWREVGLIDNTNRGEEEGKGGGRLRVKKGRKERNRGRWNLREYD